MYSSSQRILIRRAKNICSISPDPRHDASRPKAHTIIAHVAMDAILANFVSLAERVPAMFNFASASVINKLTLNFLGFCWVLLVIRFSEIQNPVDDTIYCNESYMRSQVF